MADVEITKTQTELSRKYVASEWGPALDVRGAKLSKVVVAAGVVEVILVVGLAIYSASHPESHASDYMCLVTAVNAFLILWHSRLKGKFDESFAVKEIDASSELVQVTYFYKSIQYRKDSGLLEFDEHYLHFDGQRSSFHLGRQDFDISDLRGRLILASDANFSVQFGPSDTGNTRKQAEFKKLCIEARMLEIEPFTRESEEIVRLPPMVIDPEIETTRHFGLLIHKTSFLIASVCGLLALVFVSFGHASGLFFLALTMLSWIAILFERKDIRTLAELRRPMEGESVAADV